jgi:hypothetical protein
MIRVCPSCGRPVRRQNVKRCYGTGYVHEERCGCVRPTISEIYQPLVTDWWSRPQYTTTAYWYTTIA